MPEDKMPNARHIAALAGSISLALVLAACAHGPQSSANLSLGKPVYANLKNIAGIKATADKGNADAQFKLGAAYESGQGVPQSYQEAAWWFRLAADQGFAPAQKDLGALYEYGRGVTQDKALAYALYSLASASGDKSSVDNRNRLGLELTLSQISRGQKIASDYLIGAPLPASSQ